MKSETTGLGSQIDSHESNTLRKLGFYHTFVLLGGTLANIGCVILLAFLWFGNEDNSIWRTIVVQNWATRYVAIISLVIRVVTSAQSVQCVSMLASLVLEEFETPLSSVAAVSILRFKNGGVFDLAFLHFLFRGRPGVKRVALGFATLLLFVTLSGLQFTSTALLSDMSFRNITIQQPQESIAYTHGKANLLSFTQSSGFLARDPVFPTFVEHTEPPRDLTEGVFDTGTVMRGFIPAYESAQRERVVRYSGMATFYDHRVVCVRPSEKLTHLSAIYGIEEGSSSFTMNLTGFADTDLNVSRFNGSTGGTFDCGELLKSLWSMPDTIDERQSEWSVGLCSFNRSDGGLISAMQETPLSPWYELVDEATVGGDKFVVINMTSFPTDLPSPPVHVLNFTSTGSSGEWTSFSGEGPFQDFKLSMSLCYTAGAGQHRQVEVVRPSGSRTEPKATWEPPKATDPGEDGNTYTGGWYEAGSIREQVNGVPGPLSPNTRNIFNLVDPPESWISFSRNSTYTGQGPVVYGIILFALSYELFYDSAGFHPEHKLCVTCSGVQTENTHAVYLLVTNEIIRGTTHPGLGLQALLTFYWAQNYYSEAYKFNEYANGTYWTSITVLGPVQSVFFSLIMGALVVEMVLMACITIVFLKGTRYSFLGNSWQALSQVTGESVDKWMVNGSTMTDNEIETEMKSVGYDRALVALVDSGDSRDRIRFRRGPGFSEPRAMAG